MIEALYLHIPFCEKICYYCDFKRSVYQCESADKWLVRIEQDIDTKKLNPNLKSLYLGGGTPTCLNVAQLERLLRKLKPYTKKVVEYTIESNLESIDEEKLKLLKQYGVNRISLGVQTYDDSLLKAINRQHRQADINQTIDLVYRYIPNITIDLIYGLQGQSLDIWKNTLSLATANEKIQHISVYSLTIEENSVFGKRGVPLIENDLEAAMYETAIKVLDDNEFHQYEIANFARTHRESLHNQYYWRYDDFYGLGIGASGKEKQQRYSITGSLQDYLKHQESTEIEELTVKDEIFEYVMMNLRMRKGIEIAAFQKRWNIDFLTYFAEVNDRLQHKGWLTRNKDYITTTQEGMFHLHDVLIEFMEENEKKHI